MHVRTNVRVWSIGEVSSKLWKDFVKLSASCRDRISAHGKLSVCHVDHRKDTPYLHGWFPGLYILEMKTRRFCSPKDSGTGSLTSCKYLVPNLYQSWWVCGALFAGHHSSVSNLTITLNWLFWKRSDHRWRWRHRCGFFNYCTAGSQYVLVKTNRKLPCHIYKLGDVQFHLNGFWVWRSDAKGTTSQLWTEGWGLVGGSWQNELRSRVGEIW